MQINPRIKYHYAPTEWLELKTRADNTKFWQVQSNVPTLLGDMPNITTTGINSLIIIKR